MNHKLYITRAAAAYLLDCDVRSLSTYQNRDVDPLPIAEKGKRGQSHRYDPQALMKWKVRQELAKVLEDGAVLDLNNERAKLAKLQAAKVQLDLDDRAGKFVPLDNLEQEFTRIILAVRMHFLAIPAKCAPSVFACESVSETAEKIQMHVYESLTDLSEITAAEIISAVQNER
jgi:phage terminase Nu1 subunit (DNA packaging protein)